MKVYCCGHCPSITIVKRSLMALDEEAAEFVSQWRVSECVVSVPVLCEQVYYLPCGASVQLSKHVHLHKVAFNCCHY